MKVSKQFYTVIFLCLIFLAGTTTECSGAQAEVRARLGYFNLAMIKAKFPSTVSETDALRQIRSAVEMAATQRHLDVIVDGASVYSGGAIFVENGRDVTADVAANLNMTGFAQSQVEARLIVAKVSYFNLQKLKELNPTLDIDSIRQEAEAKLRKDVNDGNEQILSAKKNGQSSAELQALASRLQQEINIKQKAYVDLVQERNRVQLQKIAQAIASLSNGQGNQIALEETGILYGMNLIFSSSPDITLKISSVLSPGSVVAAAEPPRPAAADQPPANGIANEFRPSAASTVRHHHVANASQRQLGPQPAPMSDALLAARSNSSSQVRPAAQGSSTSSLDAPIRDKWAVIIGISKFKNPTYNLQFSDKDAQDFRDFLVNEENFQPDHVLLLLNEKATRANIMRAFGSKWLPSLAEPGDLVVIYISTHGTPAQIDNAGRNYIVAYDTDADDLYATAVDMDELSQRIKEGVKTDRALIILDTCYSGGGATGSRGLLRAGNFDLSRIPVGKGHLVLSSSGADQRSWESKEYKNGVFTKNLIDVLRTSRDTDIKTVFATLAKKVEWEVRRDHGFLQTPQLGGTWQGRGLVLSLPATDPRPMSTAKLMEFK